MRLFLVDIAKVEIPLSHSHDRATDLRGKNDLACWPFTALELLFPQAGDTFLPELDQLQEQFRLEKLQLSLESIVRLGWSKPASALDHSTAVVKMFLH